VGVDDKHGWDYANRGRESNAMPQVLDYSRQSRANRNYTIALMVFAFFCLIGSGQFIFMRRSPQVNDSTRGFFELISFMYGCYALAIVATLLARVFAPAAGRLMTKALNIVLLILFPFGTILGIYGMRKVDKEWEQASSV
jgi:succinate dehydrogenase hydrophobic anchor subunit